MSLQYFTSMHQYAQKVLFSVANSEWLNKPLISRNTKQIFHAFLFNIRNYSPKVINIQRR